MQTAGLKGTRLSVQQELLWSLTEGKGPYYTQCHISLKGLLDIKDLQRALQEVIERHEIMHTVFHPLPGMDMPIQVIAALAAIDCPLIDCEHKEASQQEAALEQCSTALKEEPFDLAHGPLVRATLVRFSEQEHVLLLCMSAFCADAYSLIQVVAELARLYNSTAPATQTEGEEPLQYIDVLAWQNKLLASESAKGPRESWQKLARTAATQRPFGGKKSREKLDTEELATFAPQKLVVPLDAEVVAQMRAYTKQRNVSSLAFLFTCWKLLLWRFTHEPDMIIGLACDGRIYEELSPVLGMLTRVVPISTPIAQDQVFSEFMIAVHASLQEASDEQMYFAWDETIEERKELRFFPLTLEYNRSPAHFSTASGLEMSVLHLSSCTEPYTLKLSIHESGEHIHCEMYYDAAIISSDMAHQLAQTLQTCLSSAVEQPQAPVSRLRILSTTLEEHLLSISRAPTSAVKPVAFQQLFEQQVMRVPHQVALISGNERFTYDELNRQANSLARVLRGYGVGPNQCVGLCLARSAHMIIALLAILKAGGAYVPLDPESPSTRLCYQLQDAQAMLLLTQNAYLPHASAWDGQILSLESAMEQAAHELAIDLPLINVPQDLAYIMYTSGSTGEPKGVMIQQQSIVNYTLHMCTLVGQEAGLHFATVSTLAADLGNTVIFCALAAGGCLQVLTYETITSGDAFVAWVAAHPIDVLKIVPSHLTLLLMHEQAAKMLPRYALLLGGEVLPLSLLQRLQEIGGDCTVFNHYGPTETTIGVLVNALGRVSELREYVNSVPLGRPIANGETYILDEWQQIVPAGVIGELYIGGAGVAVGYVRQPEQTAERFVPHPFAQEAGRRLYRTGDLARYTLKGEIEFVGRRDNQIKLHGYRIELHEIEAALRRHANVSDTVVLLQEEVPGKPLLIAYIVPRSQPIPQPGALRDFMQASLPAYMVPSSFVYLKALPLTANGKVDRHYLRTHPPQHAPGAMQGGAVKAIVQPRDLIELRLLQIWEEVLQRKPISVMDNFFDLGGYSMIAVRLVSQILKHLGQDLAPATLFQHPTIASLAVVLRQQSASDDSPALVAIQPQTEGSKPPFFCVHPSGGTVFCYTNLARSLGADQPFYGLQFPAVLSDETIPRSVEALADSYITAIQTVQPQGPYFLGGWSSGGLVALEMACQLVQRGHEVALLGIMDTWIDHQMREGEIKAKLDLGDTAIVQDVLRHFKLAAPDTGTPEEQLSYALEAVIRANGAPADMTVEQLRHHANVRRINTFITHQYHPQRYPQRIHLFVANELAPLENPDDAKSINDPEEIKSRQIKDWSDLAEKGVELYRIPGMHSGLVEEPHVHTLAAFLKEAIESVSAAQGA